MRKSLSQTGLTINNLSFALNLKGINQVVRTVNNKTQLKKLQRFSTLMLNSRDIETVTDQLYNDMYAPVAQYEATSTAQSQAVVG